jgi:putative N6-adenine-specific DNA methylase
MRFFATAAKGTEPALRDELRELRFRHVRADRGGVHFEGELGDAARACLWSRIAARVLVELGAFDAPSDHALYDGVRAIDWSLHLSPRTTLAVRASVRSSALTHSQFVAQKTKDAIVDRLRDRFGARPDVDRDDPDALVSVHLAKDRATIYLDVGGASLHERGWRASAGEAPLRENLAAAVVRLSGWDRTAPLLDPMCGAGTLAIEAAAWGQRLAPGLSRARFGVERWASADDGLREALRVLRGEARAAALPEGPRVIARDVDPAIAAVAKRNAARAGARVEVDVADIGRTQPLDPPGFVVTNPPYGARLEADQALFDALARAVARLYGHTVTLLAGSPDVVAGIRRKPDRWLVLMNGPIECRLFVYSIPAAPRIARTGSAGGG